MAHAARKTRKDGTVVYYAVYRDPDGNERSAGSHPTKRQAERVADDKEREIESGAYVDPAKGKITFAKYVEDNYWPSVEPLELSTLAGYRSNIRTHFIPAFGKIPMVKITPSMIQAWVNSVSPGSAMPGARVLAPRSIKKYHVVLSSIFDYAVIERIIPFNPCTYTKFPTIIMPDKHIVTPEEFDTIAKVLGPRWIVMVETDLEVGPRWGELIALRPCDVDWPTRMVDIRRVILELRKADSVKGPFNPIHEIPSGERFVVKEYTKGVLPRKVQISPELCTMLREHMLALGIRDEDLFFTAPNGGYLSRSTFRQKVWQPAVKRAGIKRNVTFHNLRAASASWTLAGGEDVKTVMAKYGWRQLATAQGYLGTLPDAGESAITAFNRTRSRAR